MNKKFVLLDSRQRDLELARAGVEMSLGVSLNVHDSYYLGGAYFRYDWDDSSLILKENTVEDDGERAEAEFPDARIIISLAGAARAVSNLEALLTKGSSLAVVLRSRTSLR